MIANHAHGGIVLRGTIRSADAHERAARIAISRLSCGYERRWAKKAQREPATATISSASVVLTDPLVAVTASSATNVSAKRNLIPVLSVPGRVTASQPAPKATRHAPPEPRLAGKLRRPQGQAFRPKAAFA